jgi:hypothetical protein
MDFSLFVVHNKVYYYYSFTDGHPRSAEKAEGFLLEPDQAAGPRRREQVLMRLRLAQLTSSPISVI